MSRRIPSALGVLTAVMILVTAASVFILGQSPNRCRPAADGGREVDTGQDAVGTPGPAGHLDEQRHGRRTARAGQAVWRPALFD